MSYVACDMKHGYKVLVRKVLGKEHPCEMLMVCIRESVWRVQTGHVTDCSEHNNELIC